MKLKQLLTNFLENKSLSYLVSVIIMILCWMPSNELPSVEDLNDKTAHFIAFAGWSFCWFFGFRNALLTLFLGFFFGYMIEVGQFLLPHSFHRSFDYWDMAADSIGVILGIIVGIGFKKLLERA